MIRFQEERWADFVKDAAALFPLHWKELSVSQDHYGHDCDYPKYQSMDAMDMLHIVTLRDDGRLVGYAVNFIITHIHYASAGLMSLTDMYFVIPAYRRAGNGAKMFAFMESCLKKRGVVQMHTSCKVHQDHTEMLEALGWKFTDKTFMKYLGKAQ